MDTLRAPLHPVSRAVMETCLKVSNEANVETSASNAAVKKICDSQMTFRDDGNLWWQVAEYSDETLHDPHASEGLNVTQLAHPRCPLATEERGA